MVRQPMRAQMVRTRWVVADVEGDAFGGGVFFLADAGDLRGGKGDEGEVEARGTVAAPLADDADVVVELDVDGADAGFGHGLGGSER